MRVEGYEAFLERHARSFKRISGASKGEWQADDVRQEAWRLGFDIGVRLGRPLALGNPDDESLLLAHLYQHCVRYGETTVRYAQRLDQALDGDDENPLKKRLVADGGIHPATLLEVTETEDPEPPGAYHSVAAGWVWLLRRFGQRMQDVADFLLISPSWSYACCRRAVHLARSQWPLPHEMNADRGEHALQPWRKFKLPPAPGNSPRQLQIDYWQKPSQPAQGQLWLL